MIKKLMHPGEYNRSMDYMLLIVRLAGGILMLTHGWGKFERLLGDDPIKFADPLGVGATASLALAVFSEVFCAIFLILGLATRFVSIPLIITMLIAAFVVHLNDPFSKQELPMLYAVLYLVSAVAGAGRFSIDQLIDKKLARS